jgi:hypothetical protein
MVDDPDSGEGHTNTFGFYLIDAIDGTKWTEDRVNPGICLSGEGRELKILHVGHGSSNKAWELLSDSAQDPKDPAIWQFRAFDGSLQRLSLRTGQLQRRILLNQAGVKGKLERLCEVLIPGAPSELFALVRSAEGYEVYRSDPSAVFGLRWIITDPELRNDARNFDVETGGNKDPHPKALNFNGKRFNVAELHWLKVQPRSEP